MTIAALERPGLQARSGSGGAMSGARMSGGGLGGAAACVASARPALKPTHPTGSVGPPCAGTSECDCVCL